jgi:peptidoglycan/LPS O-acetylase OafA/YrhL
MYTYGFTVVYLGFGALLLASLAAPVPKTTALSVPFRCIEYIGGFSYSIYLWHIAWFFVISKLGLLYIPYLGVSIFIAGALVLGITMAKIVELPVLRIRDRIFPRRAYSGGTKLPQAPVTTLSSV